MLGLRLNGGQNTFHIGPHAQDADSEEGSTNEIRLGVNLADWLLRVNLRMSNTTNDRLERRCKDCSVPPSPVRREIKDVSTSLKLRFIRWQFGHHCDSGKPGGIRNMKLLEGGTVVREGLLA